MPYQTKVTRLEACNDTGNNEIIYNIIKDHQEGNEEPICFTGNITLTREFDDNLSYKIEVQIWQNGTWKDFGKINFKRACSDFKKLEPTWFEMLRFFNIDPANCPLSKGFHSFKCVSFQGKDLRSQSHMPLKYGRYRSFLKTSLKETLLGCLYAEGEILPI